MRVAILLLLVSVAAATPLLAAPVAPPPVSKLYHGCYYGGVGSATHDPTEHDFTPADVAKYEETVGAKTAWVFFSDNWFESRQFPAETCNSVRSLGKTPYVRLMLRSDVDQKHREKLFTLDRINAGAFDDDLRAWARDAKAFAAPILVEWGTEPNGDWFAWNGKWNGGARGPAKFVAAYRHIVDLMRSEGATNLHWIWHINWDDDPETKWNRFENYYPGSDYVDWMAISAYGPLTPTTRDGSESLATKLRACYRRVTALAPDKPILLAEFGADIHNKHVAAATWARAALEELFSGKWPAIIGFCWWNEGWQNDDVKRHDTDMIVWHDAELARVFREEIATHRDEIQETLLLRDSAR